MDPFEKSTTVDPEVRAYISSLVNAVGGSSSYDNTYAVGDDAVAVLKDLQRWLRLYDEKTNRLDVKRCLAEANLVKNDLLEILALWPEEAHANKHKAKLALACLELLVPLTWPLALEDDKATVNHHRHVPYLQLAQVGYKRAILHHEYASILRAAVRVGLPSMAQPRRDRSRRDEGIIKLILYFFRNMAMITQPQHLPSQGDENEISRSATIESFHNQDVFQVLLTVGSGIGDDFQEQDVILLEILFHLLKGVDARRLFMQKEEVATEDTQELKLLLQKERAMLNSYNKHAPTRHNRFGTMLWVQRDDQKMSTVSGQTSIANTTSTLHQMDASKKWNKPQFRGRSIGEAGDNSDWGARVELTENARKYLRQFVQDFLDSSFNPLFASLRKAIEREADRVVETTHHKQYFYLISWFLTAESARREQSGKTSSSNVDQANQATSEDNTFAYIAAVLDQETFVLLNRQMQKALDNKNWQDVQATLLCFTRILLTVQIMTESNDEEDQEIAENIQNRIFYEESTHDRIAQLLRGYAHQGFAYLDAVTECVHVFVRMLEQYSKQNVDLQIRSKRRARKKQKQQNGDGAEDDPEQAADDAEEAHRAVSERKFDFARFSAKFLSQPCLNTFISLTRYYRDLTPPQLKRAHRYFYRLAFKHELAVLLFRADILQLFLKLIKGPDGLDAAMEGFRDWEQLVQQIFRRCIKWMEREQQGDGWKEATMVEMLFSKIPGTVFYLQNGYDRIVEKAPPRAPAELEMKASVAEEQRIAVAVSVMIEQAKADALEWVKGQLQNAAEERQAWEDEQAVSRGLTIETESDMVQDPIPPPSIFISPDSDERKAALFKDKHLRLLLTILGIQRLGIAEDVDASWVIPPHITAFQLRDSLDQVKKAEFDPPTFENEGKAEDLIRSKASSRRNATFPDSDSGSDGGNGSWGELDEEMFPPNLREKRKKRSSDDLEQPRKRRRRVELTEEDLDAQRAAREKRDREKHAKIKSKLFVTDSDDESDEEKDREFFRLEAERRRKTDVLIRDTLMKNREEAKKGAKKSRGGKARARNARKSSKELIGVDLDEQEASDTNTVPSVARARSPIELSDNSPSSSDMSEDENDDEEVEEEAEANVAEDHTPSTSPTPLNPASSPQQPLKEVSGNKVTLARTTESDDDDDDDMPVLKPTANTNARRRLRAGFIVDSDSE